MGERGYIYPLSDLDRGIHICCDSPALGLPSSQKMNMAWRAVFLERPESFLAPKSHLYKHDPLILHGCHFKMCLRPENFTL